VIPICVFDKIEGNAIETLAYFRDKVTGQFIYQPAIGYNFIALNIAGSGGTLLIVNLTSYLDGTAIATITPF
jgi:hypothetical protein